MPRNYESCFIKRCYWQSASMNCYSLSWVPLVSTFVIYLFAQYVCKQFLDIDLYYYNGLDFSIQLILGYCLFCCSKKLWSFLLIQFFVIGTVHFAHASKIATLGGPLLPSDIHSLHAFVLFLGQENLFAVSIFCLLVLALLTYNTRLSRLGLGLFVLIACSGFTLFNVSPRLALKQLDKNYVYFPWDQRHNYREYGPSLYTLQALLRESLRDRQPPSKDVVFQAIEALDAVAEEPVKIIKHKNRQPNIYYFVLESFWDAGRLSGAKLSRSPLYPGFQQLWEEAGRSTVIAPTFGGGTANSEFELLCGFSSDFAPGVIFEYAITHGVECLPALLAKNGYKTFAFHANVPAFWNRVNAYRYIGFNDRHFNPSFRHYDMNGHNLSDKAVLEQALKIVNGSSENQPSFVYVMTISGHVPYALNKEKRPFVVESDTKVDIVREYANNLFYSSKEVYDITQKIRKNDPDAIIVLAGDHLPVLGVKHVGYHESGYFKGPSKDWDTEMWNLFLSTPLVVINGTKGVVNFGKVNMFDVPIEVLKLAGIDYSANPMFTMLRRDGIKVRSLFNSPKLLVYSNKTKPMLCNPFRKTSECLPFLSWRNGASVLANDVMRGQEHFRSYQANSTLL